MLLGLITIQLPEDVKIMVVMIPINALQVGTMMLTEHIYVSEMNGLSEPIKEKPVDNSLETSPSPDVLIHLPPIITLPLPPMTDLAYMTDPGVPNKSETVSPSLMLLMIKPPMI